MSEQPYLEWNYQRSFGVEFEYNAFDGKNRPDGGAGAKPKGIDELGLIVTLNTMDGVEIKDWEHTGSIS